MEALSQAISIRLKYQACGLLTSLSCELRIASCQDGQKDCMYRPGLSHIETDVLAGSHVMPGRLCLVVLYDLHLDSRL